MPLIFLPSLSWNGHILKKTCDGARIALASKQRRDNIGLMFSNRLITTIFLLTLLCTLTQFRASYPDQKTAKSSQIVPVDSIDRDSRNPRPDSPETSDYSEYGISQEIFNEYKALNEKETRYVEYKDSDDMLMAKLVQLNHINKSRAKYKAPPVRLDILASRVANRQSKEACEQGFQGHWNTRGEKPYHRYAFAGGVDHTTENACAMSTTSIFNKSIENYSNLMQKAHDGFMAEKPPHDGHKKNCIGSQHNFLGIGCYIKDSEFRYYEEFIDRYIDFIQMKKTVRVDEISSMTLEPIDARKQVFAVVVYYEPFPEPMTPNQLNKTSSYLDYTSDIEFSLWPEDINFDQETGYCQVPMKFSRRGLYYVHIYLNGTKPGQKFFTTQGKIQASGLVITASD